MLFDRICANNGIRHLLTAPYSPTTTGKDSVSAAEGGVSPCQFVTRQSIAPGG
jgi:hypothetical protein